MHPSDMFAVTIPENVPFSGVPSSVPVTFPLRKPEPALYPLRPDTW